MLEEIPLSAENCSQMLTLRRNRWGQMEVTPPGTFWEPSTSVGKCIVGTVTGPGPGDQFSTWTSHGTVTHSSWET